VNFGVDYTDDKWDVGLKARMLLDRGLSTADGVFPDNNYVIVDLGVNYKATKNIKPFLKINNLFDKFYAEHTNVAWGKPGEWYAMPGRTILVGMEYSF
jgi:vitamin B12 transporter